MNEVATQGTGKLLESVILQGDISKLSPTERVQYYKAVCDSVGLNPLTQPLAYIQLSGKSVLYAKKDATDQLRNLHGVSVTECRTDKVEDVYIVIVKVANAHGRTDMGTGAVTIKGLSGDALANALMKAETKAKRRATLSICGLGLLDETELETIHEIGLAQNVGGEIDKGTPVKSSLEGSVLPPTPELGAGLWPNGQPDAPLVDYPGEGEPVDENAVAVRKWGKQIGDAPTFAAMTKLIIEAHKDPALDVFGHKALEEQFALRKKAMGWLTRKEQANQRPASGLERV